MYMWKTHIISNVHNIESYMIPGNSRLWWWRDLHLMHEGSNRCQEPLQNDDNGESASIKHSSNGSQKEWILNVKNNNGEGELMWPPP